MSSGGKRKRRTICRDLTDTSPSVSKSNQSWERLPLEIAVHIYRYLPMNDKHNMSLTCKFWLSAFRHPGTWRYSHFVFTGNRSFNRNIPDEVLSSLQYVTIDSSVPRYTQKMKKIDRLDTFVVGLKKSKNTTLQTLNIVDMEYLCFHDTRSRLRPRLRKLLAKQTNLCRLSLVNGGFRTKRGLKLLTAAGQNSAHCLKYLNIHNFSRHKIHTRNEHTFALICGRFTNLTELSIHCWDISDDLLNHLSGTLKHIIVWVDWYDLNYFDIDPAYSDYAWNVLVSKCTGLKAEYHVADTYLETDASPAFVLLPAVPLSTLHWCLRGAARDIITPGIDEIINTFKNGLEHLHLDVGDEILSKRDVVSVVERCPLLQTFSINGTPVPIQRIPQLENIVV